MSISEACKRVAYVLRSRLDGAVRKSGDRCIFEPHRLARRRTDVARRLAHKRSLVKKTSNSVVKSYTCPGG